MTSLHYFYKKCMGTTKENLYFDIEVEGLKNKHMIATSSTFLLSFALVSNTWMPICSANFIASSLSTTFLSGSSSLLPTIGECKAHSINKQIRIYSIDYKIPKKQDGNLVEQVTCNKKSTYPKFSILYHNFDQFHVTTFSR